jgi:hypothetical protein
VLDGIQALFHVSAGKNRDERGGDGDEGYPSASVSQVHIDRPPLNAFPAY